MNHDKELLVVFIKYFITGQTASIYDSAKMFLASPEYKALGERWISVEDRLPESSGNYIVMRVHSTECECGYFTGADFTNYHGYRVTHWQYLPTPPNPEAK